MVGNLLYCAQAIDSTMLMSLNSLAAAQTKPTAETAKNITHFKIKKLKDDIIKVSKSFKTSQSGKGKGKMKRQGKCKGKKQADKKSQYIKGK